ncbi:hypothetical protein J437_LFUL001835 [Ladona fulva]|uniref:Bromo domain-containing protein n=1 Tax=Ladona fulva TaxID=123851 RepID=A0A8K0JTQ5_LADFU|nr:hypothetical protein J437_LFUL001835 [Ladona fulva]
MGERLRARYYAAGKRLFIADMTRIFTNCRLYNSPDTEYYRCANALEKEGDDDKTATGGTNEEASQAAKTTQDIKVAKETVGYLLNQEDDDESEEVDLLMEGTEEMTANEEKASTEDQEEIVTQYLGYQKTDEGGVYYLSKQ